MNSDSGLLIGRLALRCKMITAAQLQKATGIYKRYEQEKRQVNFGKLLLKLQFVTEQQLSKLQVQHQQHKRLQQDRLLAQNALQQQLLTDEQLQSAQQLQKKYPKKSLAQILSHQKVLSQEVITGLLQQKTTTDTATTATTSQELEEEDQELTVTLNIDGNGEYATLQRLNNSSDRSMLEQVLRLLRRKNVVHGLIDKELMWDFLQGKGKDSCVVATATPATESTPGTIEYLFDIDPVKAGTIKKGGVIDFRDRGAIPQLPEGTVIARRIPGTSGQHGTDIFGKPIAPIPPKKPILNCGPGTKLSADGEEVVATQDGIPVLTSSGALYMFPEQRISGNVGYKTGHIHFDGDIQVGGMIEDEFEVSGGKLTAGEIRAAKVDIKGDIVVLGGIIGATIHCGGNLRARYIHNAKLEVDGSVVVERELFRSTIQSGGDLLAKNATIFEADLSSCQDMHLGTIGTEKGASISTINLGNCESLNHELEQKREQIKGQNSARQRVVAEIEAFTTQRDLNDFNFKQLHAKQVELDSEINELEAKRVILGDNDVEAARINQRVTVLSRQKDRNDQEIKVWKKEQEKLLQDGERLQAMLADIDALILFLSNECEVLKDKRNLIGDNAQLKVLGTIHPNNRINGTRTSLVVKESRSKLTIRQKKKIDPESGIGRWVMAASAIKK